MQPAERITAGVIFHSPEWRAGPGRPFNWPSRSVREGSERNGEAGTRQVHDKGGEGKAERAPSSILKKGRDGERKSRERGERVWRQRGDREEK